MLNKVTISNLPYINNRQHKMIEDIKNTNIRNVEIFLEPLDLEYHKETIKVIEELYDMGCKFSFHGPFRKLNFLDCITTESCEDALKVFEECIRVTKVYNGEFLVIHSNEKLLQAVDLYTQKELSIRMISNVIDLAEKNNVKVVIENVGVNSNCLFNEDEFIELCKEFNSANVLIDLGHAIINKWNLKKVISELKDRIIAYHVHSNDGVADIHQPIGSGILNMSEFMDLFNEYTNEATIVIEYGIGKEEQAITFASH